MSPSLLSVFAVSLKKTCLFYTDCSHQKWQLWLCATKLSDYKKPKIILRLPFFRIQKVTVCAPPSWKLLLKNKYKSLQISVLIAVNGDLIWLWYISQDCSYFLAFICIFNFVHFFYSFGWVPCMGLSVFFMSLFFFSQNRSKYSCTTVEFKPQNCMQKCLFILSVLTRSASTWIFLNLIFQ